MRILVVGAGIAGTLTALELQQRGVHVVVGDDPLRPSASRAAAGLVNPVTGIRLTLLPGTARFLAAAEETFSGITARLGRPVWHPMPIERFFRDAGERERWDRRKRDPAYAAWTETLPETEGGRLVFGGVRIRGGGWFDYGCLPAVLERAGIPLVRGVVDHREIETDRHALRWRWKWRGEGYDHLILCPGHSGGDPWFTRLPWKAARGEILTVRSHQGPEGAVWMRGHFVIPLGDGVYRVGSTYRWDGFDAGPSSEGREEILAGWCALGLPPRPEILDHRVGIRPILQDRLPAVGPHPEHPFVWTLNGLGSRGAMMAPLLARQLADALLDGREIDPIYQAARFAGVG
ncbi:MAG: FAD-dependent oxidoreductase [Candidatus Methylacidiphilales bacterium]|nr:FAD-dependent oxidoreductase [Candidatus Methylacidiphilales bacterium]